MLNKRFTSADWCSWLWTAAGYRWNGWSLQHRSCQCAEPQISPSDPSLNGTWQIGSVWNKTADFHFGWLGSKPKASVCFYDALEIKLNPIFLPNLFTHLLHCTLQEGSHSFENLLLLQQLSFHFILHPLSREAFHPADHEPNVTRRCIFTQN